MKKFLILTNLLAIVALLGSTQTTVITVASWPTESWPGTQVDRWPATSWPGTQVDHWPVV